MLPPICMYAYIRRVAYATCCMKPPRGYRGIAVSVKVDGSVHSFRRGVRTEGSRGSRRTRPRGRARSRPRCIARERTSISGSIRSTSSAAAAGDERGERPVGRGRVALRARSRRPRSSWARLGLGPITRVSIGGSSSSTNALTPTFTSSPDSSRRCSCERGLGDPLLEPPALDAREHALEHRPVAHPVDLGEQLLGLRLDPSVSASTKYEPPSGSVTSATPLS